MRLGILRKDSWRKQGPNWDLGESRSKPRVARKGVLKAEERTCAKAQWHEKTYVFKMERAARRL